MDAYYNSTAGKSEFNELCLDALATSSQAKANAARAKILAGSSFASVVQSSSLNGTPALVQEGFTPTGLLPCVPTTSVINDLPNWAEALIQVSQRTGVPAPAFLDSSQADQGGTNDWLVIELVGKQEAPLNQQLVLDIQGTLLSQSESDLASEQTHLLSKASVTVDPQFGSWNPGKTGALPQGLAAPASKDRVPAQPRRGSRHVVVSNCDRDAPAPPAAPAA